MAAPPGAAGSGDDAHAKRARLSLEPVMLLSERQHADMAAADAESDTPERRNAILARERRLLDIRADGSRVYEDRVPLEDVQRARLERLWAERGEFVSTREEDLRRGAQGGDAQDDAGESDPLARLRALLSGQGSGAAQQATPPEPAPGSPRAANPGTIPESEFVPLRDAMLLQLDSALFNAEQAQNLLGMLITNVRSTPAQRTGASDAAAGGALAAQGEHFLEPSALALSGLNLGKDEHEQAEGAQPGAPLRMRKLVLEHKEHSVRHAASILEHGARELRRSVPAERARWQALSEVQKRGWKLTAGRPLVDVERFDMQAPGGARTNVLQGFGMPVLQGDGSVKDEAARDAWVGYGPPEAPIALLRRTLAYWADAGSTADGAPGAASAGAPADAAADSAAPRLAFPDRPWSQLRVLLTLRDDKGERVWTSAEHAAPGADEYTAAEHPLDAQLCRAQMDAADEQLFRELRANSGILSPVFPRTVTDESIVLPLSTALELRIELVPRDRATPPAGAQVSPAATLLLNLLRLRMLRGWEARIEQMRDARTGTRAPPAHAGAGLPAPLWDVYGYTLYLARLRSVLDRVVAAHNTRHAEAAPAPPARYDWSPFAMIADVHAWAAALFDPGAAAASEPECGGTVAVWAGTTLVAQLTLRAPSHMLAYFPQRATHAGVGVQVALELEQLAPLLQAELHT